MYKFDIVTDVVTEDCHSRETIQMQTKSWLDPINLRSSVELNSHDEWFPELELLVVVHPSFISSLVISKAICSVLTLSFWGTAECYRHQRSAATPFDLKFASQWVCQQFSGSSTSFVTWQQFVDMQVASFIDLQFAVNLCSRREKMQRRTALNIHVVWSHSDS